MPISLTRPTAERLRQLKAQTDGVGFGPPPRGGTHDRLTVFVQCLSTAAAAGAGVGSQCYSGVIVDLDATQTTQPTLGNVWLTLLANPTTVFVPTYGFTYECVLAGPYDPGSDSRPRAFAVPSYPAWCSDYFTAQDGGGEGAANEGQDTQAFFDVDYAAYDTTSPFLVTNTIALVPPNTGPFWVTGKVTARVSGTPAAPASGGPKEFLGNVEMGILGQVVELDSSNNVVAKVTQLVKVLSGQYLSLPNPLSDFTNWYHLQTGDVDPVGNPPGGAGGGEIAVQFRGEASIGVKMGGSGTGMRLAWVLYMASASDQPIIWNGQLQVLGCGQGNTYLVWEAIPGVVGCQTVLVPPVPGPPTSFVCTDGTCTEVPGSGGAYTSMAACLAACVSPPPPPPPPPPAGCCGIADGTTGSITFADGTNAGTWSAVSPDGNFTFSLPSGFAAMNCADSGNYELAGHEPTSQVCGPPVSVTWAASADPSGTTTQPITFHT